MTMSANQEQHLQSVKEDFLRVVDQKYRRGAKEHDGELMDLSPQQLTACAIEEAVDQVVYLLSLRNKIGSGAFKEDSIPAWLLEQVREEMEKAESSHGPLTPDPLRAFAILSEEVGEVSKAILEWGRAERVGKANEFHKDSVVNELVQVLSVTVQMVVNLRRTGNGK